MKLQLAARARTARATGFAVHVRSSMRTQSTMWMLACLICPCAASAQSTGDGVPETVLQETVVSDQREIGSVIDPVRSRTTITSEALERRQPENIFKAVEDIPGVSINGGPRASGMKFNIRGFSDTEDVAVVLDGATKGFEKYRFGGTFLEPELLKTIDVERGPSIISGSGAIGGSVSATTKSAEDLLRPGERIGARIKGGYADNNDEVLGSLMAYGRPTERVDLLASGVRRRSGDITLSNGQPLRDSQADNDSVLAKIGILATDHLGITLSYTGLDDSGRQPYDATGGQPGVFGTVRRTIHDKTWTGALNYQNGSWIDSRMILGYAQTTLHDLIRPEDNTPFANSATGNVVDQSAFDTWTLDYANTSRARFGPIDNELKVGVQSIYSSREISRITQNSTINNALYPGGFNASAPPGDKTSIGVFAQNAFIWKTLSFIPGVRWDRYEVQAQGGTRQILAGFGEPSSVSYTHISPAATLSWQPASGPVRISGTIAKGFRPPLIDEAFTQGAFSRCATFLLHSLAPKSQICGALYQPEQALNRELSISYAGTDPTPLHGTLEMKATVFKMDVTNMLESLSVVSPGVVAQPGREKRRGSEFELGYSRAWLFGSVGYATVDGTVYDGITLQPIFDVPGDTFTSTLGVRLFSRRLEMSWRYRSVAARRVTVGLLPGNRPIVGTQAGYSLNDFYLTWHATPNATVWFAAENFDNERYFLNDGFGGSIGSEAPGRNLRVTLGYQF